MTLYDKYQDGYREYICEMTELSLTRIAELRKQEIKNEILTR